MTERSDSYLFDKIKTYRLNQANKLITGFNSDTIAELSPFVP